MYLVHLKSGETLQFDLAREGDAQRWLEHAKNLSFQSQITAVTLHQNGVQYSLPRPVGFDSIFIHAEHVSAGKGSDVIMCNAGDIGVVMTAHAGQKAARINIKRQGKQRFNPLVG